MSNKNEQKAVKRPYILKARARRRDQVHSRITKAAVKLHESIGPAKTTMNAIAELAGVRRATVYNHFPTELELIDACSSHWMSQNPPPDLNAWAEIDDPVARARQALADMYAYFDGNQQMLGNVLRDAAVVPAMDEIRHQKWQPMINGIADLLVDGWQSSGKLDVSAESRIRATARVALDFFAWQNLSSSGLSTRNAAALAAGWIEASAR
ncbi:TetR family transcriptional regulator, partial [candidate division GN15 bacterium]|nr:TetR family transcriptional regulator [candidate division GN15 bacterium]